MDIMLVKDDIIESLKTIMSNRFQIPAERFNYIDLDKHLMSKDYGFNHRHFLYLLHDIEEYFSIQIPDDVILNGHFTSMNNISEAIYLEVMKKNE